MAMIGFGRDQSFTDINRLKQHLDEAFPEEGDREKLRGLILCVRRRYRGAGYEQEAIAQRAGSPPHRVAQVIAGNFTQVRWDSIEAVLKALDANDTERAMAWRLYDQLRRRPVVLDPPADPCKDHRHPQQSTPRWTIELSLPTVPPRTSGSSNTVEPDGSGKPAEAPAPLASAPKSSQAEQTEAVMTIAQGQDGSSSGDPENLRCPTKAQTVGEFVMAMKMFRAAKGGKVFRLMAQRCQDLNPDLQAGEKNEVKAYTSASFNTIGKNGKLPRLELTRSFIVGAGGDLDDLEFWEKAWSRLSSLLQAAESSS